MADIKNGPIGVAGDAGKLVIGVVEPDKNNTGPQLTRTPVPICGGNYSIYMTPPKIKVTCRWCQKEVELEAAFVQFTKCPLCKASQNSFCINMGEVEYRFWHNPDNSIYIEVLSDGKGSRYKFTEEMLAKIGILEVFDHDPKGKQ